MMMNTLLVKASRKRTVLTFDQKIELLHRMRNGESMGSLASEYGLGLTTVRDLRDNAPRILSLVKFCQDFNITTSTRRSMKAGINIKIEQQVSAWYGQQVSERAIVSDQDLFEATEKICRTFGVRGYPSESWIRDFKILHGLGLYYMPDLGDRVAGSDASSPRQLDSSSSFVHCAPVLGEDPLPGPSSVHDPLQGGQDETGDDSASEIKAEFTMDETLEDDGSNLNPIVTMEQPSTPRSSGFASGMSGCYLLKKDTHCSTILDQLLHDETFADVTLTAQGQSMKAHRIVLSLASGYFKDVLDKDSGVKNVIVFRDLKFTELKNIINFIYTGEVTVDASELESFMSAAEMLDITSLSDGHKSLPKQFISNQRKESPSETPIPVPKSSSKRSAAAASSSSSTPTPPTKSRKVVADSGAAASSSSAVGSEIFVDTSIIKSEVELFDEDGSLIREGANYYPPESPDDPIPGKCPYCPLSKERERPDLVDHLQSSHPSKPSFHCECNRIYTSRTCFKIHKRDCAAPKT